MDAYTKCGHSEIEHVRVCLYSYFRISAQPGVCTHAECGHSERNGGCVCGPYAVSTAEGTLILAIMQFTVSLGHAGSHCVSVCLSVF